MDTPIAIGTPAVATPTSAPYPSAPTFTHVLTFSASAGIDPLVWIVVGFLLVIIALVVLRYARQMRHAKECK